MQFVRRVRLKFDVVAGEQRIHQQRHQSSPFRLGQFRQGNSNPFADSVTAAGFVDADAFFDERGHGAASAHAKRIEKLFLLFHAEGTTNPVPLWGRWAPQPGFQ